MNRIFRQYFDAKSCTYTYLLADITEKIGVFIDTVQEHTSRDLTTIKEFDLDNVYLLSTHIHADHVTGNALLKDALGKQATSVISKYYQNAKADKHVGHTSGCLCIVDHDNQRVFTGDALLIRGCGRTDFQGGSAEQLYDSVHDKLFKLPHNYAVYPAHDYQGRTSTSIGEEVKLNPRLTKTKDEFVKIMANLNLAYPKMLDIAVPLNLNCGYKATNDEN